LSATLVGLWSVPSHAEPTLSDKETARSLFTQGDEKYRAGDYDGALKAFEAADAIMGVPTTGLERGRTLAQLGRLLEAREVLLKVSRLPPGPEDNEVQQRARREAHQLAEAVGQRIPSVQVRVRGLDPDARYDVVIDDEPVPESLATFPRKLDPGEHVVMVRAPGYRTQSRVISVRERENLD